MASETLVLKMNLPSVTMTHFYEVADEEHDNSDLDRKDTPFGQSFASRVKKVELEDCSSSDESYNQNAADSWSSGLESDEGGSDTDEDENEGKIPHDLKKETKVSFCMQKVAKDDEFTAWIKQIN